MSSSFSSTTKDIPVPVHAFRGVVVLHRSRSAVGLVVADDPVHEDHRVLRRVGPGDVQRRAGQDLVPARAEEQSVVPDDPGVFELLVASGGVEEQVVHPQALLAGPDHHLAEPVAGHVDAQVALQVLPQQVLVGMRYGLVVLVIDKDVRFPGRALRGVVVADGSLPSLLVITPERLPHQVHSELSTV